MSEKTHNPKLARDFFLHLLAFITLYASMIATIAILFQFVNILVPDELSRFADPRAALRWGVSFLIVSFPVFTGIKQFLRRKSISSPHFPIYFTLFVAGLTAIIDIIVIVFRYLDGDLSLRAALKILVVLAVAATVFLYELWNLKRKSGRLGSNEKLVLAGSYAVILIIIVGAFVSVGTPGQQRAYDADRGKENSLRMADDGIARYYSTQEKLPSSLLGLISNNVNEQVEYRVISEDVYELCATFESDGDPYRRKRTNQAMFQHGVGRFCFERNVNDVKVGIPSIGLRR